MNDLKEFKAWLGKESGHMPSKIACFEIIDRAIAAESERDNFEKKERAARGLLLNRQTELLDTVLKLRAVTEERDELKAKLAEIGNCYEVTPEMLRAAQLNSHLGSLACSQMGGGYDLIRELFEVMASKIKPAAPAQRITEQDAREILYAYGVSGIGTDEWLCSDAGRTLLAKLNEHREPAEAEHSQWEKLSNDEVLKIAPMAGNFTEWEKECFAGGFRRCAEMIKVTANKAEVPSIALRSEIDRLNAIINSPQKEDFIRAVSTEAEHQRQRWGVKHDGGKSPSDWFWLIGYLAGKALHAHASDNLAKAEHHIITTAAACANWHKAMFGKTDMRPGLSADSLPPLKDGKK